MVRAGGVTFFGPELDGGDDFGDVPGLRREVLGSGRAHGLLLSLKRRALEGGAQSEGNLPFISMYRNQSSRMYGAPTNGVCGHRDTCMGGKDVVRAEGQREGQNCTVAVRVRRAEGGEEATQG